MIIGIYVFSYLLLVWGAFLLSKYVLLPKLEIYPPQMYTWVTALVWPVSIPVMASAIFVEENMTQKYRYGIRVNAL